MTTTPWIHVQEVADVADSTSQSANDDAFGLALPWTDRLAEVAQTAVEIVFILAVAWLLIKVMDRAIARWTRSYRELPPLDPSRQRALTVSELVRSASRYLIWPIASIAALSELEIDVTALIATAGVAGLALGFGAQTLVKDVIAGIFLLFDGTIAVGDRVHIGDEYGLVEHIGVRLIKVRKYNGELMMVPAGELRVFGNTSIDFSRAVIDVGISYSADLDDVLPVLDTVARQWANQNPEALREESPEVLSIMSFGDSSVGVRVSLVVKPGEQFRAEREIRSGIKQEFDRRGIEIPFSQLTVHIEDRPAEGV